MNSEKYFHDNPVGCFLSQLREFKNIPENAESRRAWYCFLMKKESHQTPIPESDYPELYSKYGEFLSRIELCKSSVKNILPERLYQPTFDGIYAILRNSWEGQGTQIASYFNGLQTHFTGLEFIAERISKEKGVAELIDDSHIQDFKAEVNAFRERVFNTSLPVELQIRLMRCASSAERAIDDYLDRGINSFQDALELIWKEVVFYVFDKEGNSNSEKTEVIRKAGVFQLISSLSNLANIVTAADKLLTAFGPALKLIS